MDNFNLKKFLIENRINKESVEFNKIEDDNEFDDIPSIKMQIIDDGEENSPSVFFKMSAMYHDGSNGKMEKLKDDPKLQEEVMNTLQEEFQKTFRRVIHSILGEPFGLDENK